VTPRQRGATFGRAYWQKPHPDVTPIQAQIYLVRRQWRGISRRLIPVIEAFKVAFGEVGRTVTAAAQQFAQFAVAAQQMQQSEFVLWPDAQRVQPEDYDDPDWTLGRIDGALTGWETQR